MAENDEEYLQARAEAELKLAQEAEHAAAVRAHYLLAGLYLDRLHSSAAEENAPNTAEDRKI